MRTFTIDQFSQLIDHTNLKPFANDSDMKKLCDEAKEYHFRMVAINQVQSALCAKFLAGSDVHIGAAISFPLGQTTIESKVFDTKDAIQNGANEIDYVVNLTEVKNQNFDFIKKEMEAIVAICKPQNVICKVIFENAYLEKNEIEKLSLIAKEVRPDFIKTSTGFAPTGATFEDVRLMKETVGDTVKVKAAGGIRDVETFLGMIRAGAERIGTSSGIEIITDLKKIMAEKNTDTLVVE